MFAPQSGQTFQKGFHYQGALQLSGKADRGKKIIQRERERETGKKHRDKNIHTETYRQKHGHIKRVDMKTE